MKTFISIITVCAIVTLTGWSSQIDDPRGPSTPINVCHRNDNSTYTEITIRADEFPPHFEHGDIYPVPRFGCGPITTTITLPSTTTSTTTSVVETTTTLPEIPPLTAAISTSTIVVNPEQKLTESGTPATLGITG